MWSRVPWSGGARGIGRSCEVNRCGVCGEDGGVVNFANNPFLDEVDVLNCGNLDGLLVVIEPGVCVSVLVSLSRGGKTA